LKEKFAEYNPIFVSAFKKINLEELKDKIVEILN
jgi:hypothetical protein